MSEPDLSSYSDEKLQGILDEIESRRSKGDNPVHPGRDIAGITSASTKSTDPDALLNEEGNFSAFTGWDDPSQKMNPRVRQAMLYKSLNDVGYQYKGHWDTFGEFVKEGWNSHRDGDFQKKHRSSFEGIGSDFLKARGMTTTSGEAGGYLVNPEIAPTIDWLFNPNDLSSRIDTLNTSQTYYKFPRAKDLNRNDGTRHGGILSKWIDEGDPGDESRPKLTFTDLKMKKLAVFVFMTSEIASDTPYAIENYVKDAVREEINFAINRAIMWGAGGVEPIGFANGATTIEVAAEGGQTPGTFIYENALQMLSQLYRTSKTKAVWLHHQTVIPEIGKLALNNYPVSVNIQNGGVTNDVISTMLGRQAIESELCAPLGSAGDVWYVDPSQYKAIAQSMVREDVSMHVEFMSDQNCLRFLFRFDGRPLFDKPITPFKAPGAASDPPQQSGFLKLAAR